MDTGILIFISVLVYGVICVLISIRGHRKASTSEGFFVGSRSFGIILTLCSVVMGIYSALAFYGFPGMIMRDGVFCQAAGGFGIVGLCYPLIGYRLWKIGKGRGYVTTADFLRDRYYSNGYGILISLVQLFFIIPYITLQFVAIGNALSLSSGNSIPYVASILVFAVFSAVYIVIGGAGGLGLMDVFNAACAVFIPIVAVIIIVGNAFGGDWNAVGEAARAQFPDINNAAAFGSRYAPINIFSSIITGVIATFGSPHIVSKLYMSKDRKTFQKMTWTGGLFYAYLGIPILMMGVIGTALYKSALGDAGSDNVVPLMMLDHTNLIIVIGMLWVLFAFATSTTNAFTISGASVISKDLVGRYGLRSVTDPVKKEQLSVRIGKIGVLAMVCITIVVSLTRPAYLVDYAYSFASPGFAQALPAMILGMYWKRCTREAAWAGTVGGLVTLMITMFVVPNPMGINAVMWALGVNFLLLIVVTFVTKPPMSVVKDFFPMPKSAAASSK